MGEREEKSVSGMRERGGSRARERERMIVGREREECERGERVRERAIAF